MIRDFITDALIKLSEFSAWAGNTLLQLAKRRVAKDMQQHSDGEQR